MLEGNLFTIYIDHKPLTYILFRVTDAWTAHQGRHSSYVAVFSSDIQHVPGTENVVAEILSRPPGLPAQPGGRAATCGTQEGQVAVMADTLPAGAGRGANCGTQEIQKQAVAGSPPSTGW